MQFLSVVATYCALGVWLILLGASVKRRSYRAFLLYGVGLMIVLNFRYAIVGAERSIAFFVGLYDAPYNVGASSAPVQDGLILCAPDRQCSTMGDSYNYHASWAVAFHERFSSGNVLRNSLLGSHIVFTTLAFISMMAQFFNPGSGKYPRVHKWLGYTSFGALTVGLISSCLLAVEHKSVVHYGGPLSMVGFWFMASCVFVCVIMGLVAIKKKDIASHRKWMVRYAGSLWGSFWVFRAMELVIGPLLRKYDPASILICIWGSAPLGILIAELAQKSAAKRAVSSQPVQQIELNHT